MFSPIGYSPTQAPKFSGSSLNEKDAQKASKDGIVRTESYNGTPVYIYNGKAGDLDRDSFETFTSSMNKTDDSPLKAGHQKHALGNMMALGPSHIGQRNDEGMIKRDAQRLQDMLKGLYERALKAI